MNYVGLCIQIIEVKGRANSSNNTEERAGRGEGLVKELPGESGNVDMRRNV